MRQLVEGHEAVAGICGGGERVPPGVAEIDAAEPDAARPDRAEMPQQGLENARRRDAALAGLLGEDIEQPARPRLIGLPEHIPIARHHRSETVEERGAPVEADERIVDADLEAARQLVRIERHQRLRIDAERVVRPAGKGAADEQVEARQGEPLRARVGLAGAALVIAPVGSGAGVEQHADDGEIERGAAHGGGVRPIDRLGDRRPAVDAAGGEMAPAAVEGNVEIGISGTRGGHHLVGAGVEAIAIDREMIEPPGEPMPQEPVRALAHRRSGEEAMRQPLLRRSPRLFAAQWHTASMLCPSGSNTKAA